MAKKLNVVVSCSEDVYKYYAEKNVEIQVKVHDTYFFVLLVRRKAKITLFFRCLKQYYSYTLDDELPSVIFDFDWLKQYFVQFYETKFQIIIL